MAVRALKCCFFSTVTELKRLDDAGPTPDKVKRVYFSCPKKFWEIFCCFQNKIEKLKVRVGTLITACRELMTRDAAALRECVLFNFFFFLRFVGNVFFFYIYFHFSGVFVGVRFIVVLQLGSRRS